VGDSSLSAGRTSRCPGERAVQWTNVFVSSLHCTSGLWTMTELCERHAISRKTGLQVAGALPFGRGSRFGGAVLCAAGAWTCDCQPPGRCDCGSAAGASKLGAAKIVSEACTGQPEVTGRRPPRPRDPETGGLVCGRRLRRRAPPRMATDSAAARQPRCGGSITRAGSDWAMARAPSR